MHSELLKKFAAELKICREDKQVSLNQIAAKTRIDLKYLSAIENGNFDVLPDLYIRAFIKEYAMNVDLNPEETIKKFDLARAGKTETPEELEKESGSAGDKPRRATRSFKKQFESEDIEPYSPNEEIKRTLDPRILYAGIAVAVIIVIAGLYFVFFSSTTTIEKENLQSAQNNTARTDIKKYEEPQTVQQNSVVSADSLQLQIIANDLVWFEVSSDESTPVQFLFKNTQSTTVKAKTKFTMNIGNAGGVKLILNGKTLEPLGRPGDVKNVQIDKDGVKLLTLDRPKNERAPAAAKAN